MFFSTVNGSIGIVMSVVMTKAGILRHVGQLTSLNSQKKKKAGFHRPLRESRLKSRSVYCKPSFFSR
ncbi:hypothetical protein EXT67_09015 [Pectobacterium atrosepticum]|nr:hypothetical protein CVS35_01465 [Pectobacterium atrosepticum]MCL6316480.1 hypothetical protein [Pectobacterium atrosepticum]MCL6321023.1 hypothetical protein [Pectobacterium atrosepticum]MCL6388924.1 hypothetical protein [Pectobacterium atrosepticum]PWD54508.1 hypothetical protein DF214_21140 [Pectobacterium atrosepticum]